MRPGGDGREELPRQRTGATRTSSQTWSRCRPRSPGTSDCGVAVAIDVSTDGKTYVAQVASDSLSLTRARNPSKLLSQGCVSLKSGAKCPAA